MSSIDLTVTSRIVHLRHREKTFAEVQLDRAPKLIAGDDLGFLLPKATQRWNEQLHNRFRAVGWGHVRSSYGSILVPLFEEDGLRMGELACRAHMSKETMTAIVLPLGGEGLVDR